MHPDLGNLVGFTLRVGLESCLASSTSHSRISSIPFRPVSFSLVCRETHKKFMCTNVKLLHLVVFGVMTRYAW
jgi:hypothetical protein